MRRPACAACVAAGSRNRLELQIRRLPEGVRPSHSARITAERAPVTPLKTLLLCADLPSTPSNQASRIRSSLSEAGAWWPHGTPSTSLLSWGRF